MVHAMKKKIPAVLIFMLITLTLMQRMTMEPVSITVTSNAFLVGTTMELATTDRVMDAVVFGIQVRSALVNLTVETVMKTLLLKLLAAWILTHVTMIIWLLSMMIPASIMEKTIEIATVTASMMQMRMVHAMKK